MIITKQDIGKLYKLREIHKNMFPSLYDKNFLLIEIKEQRKTGETGIFLYNNKKTILWDFDFQLLEEIKLNNDR